ncbi:MAG: M23 family metallopeptidase [Bacteroidota bacterium]|nr:M23 family metallopeptidase [Bacteroidota bacterium]
MRAIILFLLFLNLGSNISVQAQEVEEIRVNDFYKIKVPKIRLIGPDTSRVLPRKNMDLVVDENKNLKVNITIDSTFNNSFLKRTLSIVSEDSTESIEDYFQIVEISEELKIDCVWVTSQEYFSIWDTKSVNPYKIDGTKFSDDITLVLYNQAAEQGWSCPLEETRITSNFGMRSYRWHYGTDLKCNIGDPIKAAFDGIVRITQYDGGGYGNYILVRHTNGLETLYGHLSATHVKVGQVVKAGEVIGLGGNTGRSTGPHLHYEVRYQGNPLNPLEMYDFEKNLLKFDTLKVTAQSFAYLKESRKIVYHSVLRGENLGVISRKYKVPINTISKLNKISTKSVLRVGQRLRIR